MPLPDRPVANTTMESAWGQAVHDYTFAPKGCDLNGTTVNVVDTTPDKCYLHLAADDPGGFLDAANNQAVVPTGGEGLYIIDATINSVNGGAGTQTRIWVYINGSPWRWANEDNNGGTNVSVSTNGLADLTAGDTVQVWCQRRGSGADPTVHVLHLQLVRIGAELGA